MGPTLYSQERFVTAPDGSIWKVRRRWRRAPQWRRPRDEVTDVLTLFPDEAPGAVAFIAIGLLVAVVILVVLPLILFVAEAVALAVGVYVLRKPWTVEATTSGSPPRRLEWRVRGWRALKRALEEVTRQLESETRIPGLPDAEAAADAR